MKYISWNVNGLRAVMNKGFTEFIENEQADFICLQEIKLQENQIDMAHLNYDIYWNYAEKKGYSGTAILTKQKPLNVTYGINTLQIPDNEGRVITLEFANYYLINIYTPNSKRDLSRLPYRMEWEEAMREYLTKLNGQKPLIFCGDLNVAHTEIDIKNSKGNRGNSGFTDEEREKFTQLLQTGFIDSYRSQNPQKLDAYTWWSYRFNARERNIGWRIDYFCLSECLAPKIKNTTIYAAIMGSDHCPIGLEITM